MIPLPIAKSQWNYKALLLSHLLIALLVSSLLWPVTQVYWEAIDVAFFKWINGSLEGRPLWQTFWALANHRGADYFEDICFLTFFVFYVREAGKHLRPRRIAELLFCVLYAAAIIYFINRVLFRENLSIPRLSPTLVIDESIRISDYVTWLKVKVHATKSFPGDHGTTAILFVGIFAYLANWRMKTLAALYGAFLCLPRLITGAHWLSDVVVGSGSIALFFLSWAFYTPLFSKCVGVLERLFKKKKQPLRLES